MKLASLLGVTRSEKPKKVHVPRGNGELGAKNHLDPHLLNRTLKETVFDSKIVPKWSYLPKVCLRGVWLTMKILDIIS